MVSRKVFHIKRGKEEVIILNQSIVSPKYPEDFLNKIICGDSAEVMKAIPDNSIDLVVTSPPYDDLRIYEGYNFNFEEIADQLYRVMAEGGIVVWVVGDRIRKGNKSLTSFRQGLYFQDIGFKIHDVMIYRKKNTPFMRSNAYTNCYEFMHVLTKGKVKTFNPIKVPTKRSGVEMLVSNRKADGIIRKVKGELKKMKTKTNIWDYAVGLGGTTNDKIAFKHPATFPEKLVEDHILSWTNEGDIVLDPMCGSGTTCKMAKLMNRKFIGIDVSEEYCEISKIRLRNALRQKKLD
jgi:DNA modification methylase